MSETRSRRTLWTLSALGALAVVTVGVLPWHGEATDAAFTDEAAAVLEATGAYDLAVEGRTTGGAVEVGEGNPTDLDLATPHDARFSLTDPVTWQVAVLGRAAPGEVTLRITDPQDLPFTVGSTTHPDLFQRLVFTVADATSGEVLLADADAATVARPLALGHLDTGDRRDLTVSAVVAPGTWSVYDSRTTSLRLTFEGTT